MMMVKLFFEQTKVLSEIFVGLGLIFFASTVIPFLFPAIASIEPLNAMFSLVASSFCWANAIVSVSAKG